MGNRKTRAVRLHHQVPSEVILAGEAEGRIYHRAAARNVIDKGIAGAICGWSQGGVYVSLHAGVLHFPQSLEIPFLTGLAREGVEQILERQFEISDSVVRRQKVARRKGRAEQIQSLIRSSAGGCLALETGKIQHRRFRDWDADR